jgi:hypothetical protein
LQREEAAMPSLSAYLVTAFISIWVTLSGLVLTACGLLVCHMEAVVEDGVAALGLGGAALIASTLVLIVERQDP